MLGYMRKNANSTVVWFIIGAIALVFVFFGVGGGGGGYNSIKVNGEDVNYNDFYSIYQALSRQVEGEKSPELDREIKRAAVGEVVNQKLIQQFAEKLGLLPSNQLLAEFIASKEMFQTDGKFDLEKYEALIKATRSSKVRFEAQEKKELALSMVAKVISGLARVHMPNILEKYHFQEDQIAVDYIFFSADNLEKNLLAEEDQLKDYYLSNQEKWRKKSSMKLEYVEIKPADFIDKLEVSDEELMEIYKESGERFAVQESANASHILFRFPNMNPSDEEKINTLEKARAAYERSKEENFAELAAELSEDKLTSADGGELGEVSRGVYFENMENVIFNAPLSEVSEPVETSVGYHLFKVNSRQEAGLRPFEEVKDVLVSERKVFKARNAAVAQLEDLLERSESNPNLAEAAKSMGLEAKISDFFTEDDAPSFFEGNSAAINKAFSSRLGKVAFPVEEEDHLVLFTPLERIDSFIPAFDDVKNSVNESWLKDEALRLARLDAVHFISLAQAGGDAWDKAYADLPERIKAEKGKTELNQRPAMPSLEADLAQVDQLEFFRAIYSMAVAGQVSPITAKGRKQDGESGVFVFKLTDYQKADISALGGPELGSFTAMMLSTKANSTFLSWREILSEDTTNKVLVPPDFLN